MSINSVEKRCRKTLSNLSKKVIEKCCRKKIVKNCEKVVDNGGGLVYSIITAGNR